MKKTRHTTDQIIEKLRQADVALGKGQKVPDVCKRSGDYGADVLSLASEVRRDGAGDGEGAEGSSAGERPAEEAGGEPGLGHGDSEGSRQGKLVSPERRRRTVVRSASSLGA